MKKYLFLFIVLSCSLFANKELKILNWPEYIDVDLLKKFTAKTGIPINYKIYKNNEELLSLLSSKQSYDIVFPSSSYLKMMIKNDFILKIDTQRLENHKKIDKFFLDSKELKEYAIPYTWGTTGVLYNQNKVSIKSFGELWSQKFKDKLFILDDMNDMFAITFNSLGIDLNTKSKSDIKKAYEKLLELIPNIKGIYSDSEKLKIEFINENIFAAIVYNGDIADIVNEDYKYLYPKEGALLWIDSIAIGTNTNSLDEVYKFIDFIISKENAMKNFKKIGYAPPIKDLKFDTNIYPNKAQKRKLKRVIVDDNEKYFIDYWEKFLKELSKKGVTYE